MSVNAGTKENDPSTEGYSKQKAQQEMQYLRDPFRLADHVQKLLQHGEVQRAYDLVLVSANEGSRNIVSWNHLMDYHMSKGKVSDALKYYNQVCTFTELQYIPSVLMQATEQMKKRGTKPDSHTYMLMLRGLAQKFNDKNAVSQALSIYTSMKAANSTVTPSIIHHNSMLNVCNKAGDIDALFGVAGGMPEKGPNSPDAWSYAIILSALMSHVHKLKTMYSVDDVKREKEIREVMKDGRKIWEDIIRRWRAGDVSIDERLVSTMARLLLAPDIRLDARAVFSLIHQTMNVPIPGVAKVEMENAAKAERRFMDKPEPALIPISTDTPSDPLAPPDDLTAPLAGYVKPGNSILNCLLQAAYQVRSRKMGDYYWNRFNHPQTAIPVDFGNLCEYLNLLALSHASTKAAETLGIFRDDPSKFNANNVAKPSSWPFFLGMEACRRDKNSKHAFSNANAIFDIMQNVLPNPDPKILRVYLLIARITTPGLPTYSPAGQLNSRRKRAQIPFDPKSKHNHLIQALRRVTPDAVKLRQVVDDSIITAEPPDPFAPPDYSTTSPRQKDQTKGSGQREAWLLQERIRLLAQDMESDCTRLLAKGLEDETVEQEFEELKQRCAGWMKRWKKMEWRNDAISKSLRRDAAAGVVPEAEREPKDSLPVKKRGSEKRMRLGGESRWSSEEYDEDGELEAEEDEEDEEDEDAEDVFDAAEEEAATLTAPTEEPRRSKIGNRSRPAKGKANAKTRSFGKPKRQPEQEPDPPPQYWTSGWEQHAAQAQAEGRGEQKAWVTE